jgi:hypothetical protein
MNTSEVEETVALLNAVLKAYMVIYYQKKKATSVVVTFCNINQQYGGWPKYVLAFSMIMISNKQLKLTLLIYRYINNLNHSNAVRILKNLHKCQSCTEMDI